MQRYFFDWSQPFLPAVAEWVLGLRAPGGGGLDLQGVVCVTPGRRAGRLLLAELAARCEAAGDALLPPRTITPGALAEAMLVGAGPVATREECGLAWIDALRGAGPLTLRAVVPAPPEEADLVAWHELARSVHRVYEELAAADLDFGDVPARAASLDLFGETERWEALAHVAALYAQGLESAGRADPVTARRAALAEGKLRDHRHLVLIGVTELNAQQRGVVRASGERAAALVHAPEALADRFDEAGCVRPEAWVDVPCSLRDEQILVAGDPADQAQVALRALAALGDDRAIDEVTIGLGDPELAGAVERAAGLAELRVHPAEGIELRLTPPLRLLEAAAAWLEDGRFATLAALVRHPDVERWLDSDAGGDGDGASFDRLTAFDDYFTDHLPARFTRDAPGTGARRAAVEGAARRIGALLRPLRGRRRRLGEWAGPVLEVLATVYERHATGPADNALVSACLRLRDGLARHAGAAPSLQPETGATTALRVLLGDLARERVAADVRADQVEQLGWLELHLDPAPVLVILGVNDGRVPHVIRDDPFLPDALRRQLGLAHNAAFLARDAYLLEALVHAKPHLRLVAGRTNRLGDPLAPSRLLLRCPDEALVRRVRRLCDDDGERATQRPDRVGAPAPGPASRFVVPALPPDLPGPDHLSATGFRRYLECGYRFALERLVRLRARDDAAAELDPLRFGLLAHEVLEAFGADASIRDSASAPAIAAHLRAALEARARARFGDHGLPAIELQVARLQQRLDAFAVLQAELRTEGWVIRHTERTYAGEDVLLDVPGQAPMPIHGKIDRIDQHEESGAWRVIDYKTSERGPSPAEQHHPTVSASKEAEPEWTDLQLPLYRYLAQQSGDVTGEPELAYIVLPKKAADVALRAGTWTPRQLDGALDVARDIVRDIRAGVFELSHDFGWPNDPYARLCQRLVFADADEGGESS